MTELYQYGRRGAVLPMIIGCVSYQILQDDKIHQTTFAYFLDSTDGRIFSNEGPYPDPSVVVAPGGFAT
jgi:hypothetical protein